MAGERRSVHRRFIGALLNRGEALRGRREALGTALNSQVLRLFEGRILAFGSDCAQPFSKLVASANQAGNSISFADAVIAAIALASGYAVATRNVHDFVATGVKIVNPWLA